MRIFDKKGIQLETPDFKKGYLKEDTIFVAHHEAVEAVKEKGHWKTIAEYPNGGKDVEWVVDIPAVKAEEAWDEYEDIYRYVEYAEDELAAMEEEKKNLTVEERLSAIESSIKIIMDKLFKTHKMK